MCSLVQCLHSWLSFISFEMSQIWPACPSDDSSLVLRRIWARSVAGLILTGENRSTRRKSFPSATLSTTHPTWDGPELNPALRSERPATNHLNHDTALNFKFIQTMYNNSLCTSQRTHHLPCTKTSQLIECACVTIGVYFSNCTAYTKQVVHIVTNAIQKYSVSITHTTASLDTRIPRCTAFTRQGVPFPSWTLPEGYVVLHETHFGTASELQGCPPLLSRIGHKMYNLY
jgi:hypothetical protein